MSNVTDSVDECALELEVVGTRWDKKTNWRCFGEVILYVMTSPEKLKESFIAKLDSYFDTASPPPAPLGNHYPAGETKTVFPDMSHRLRRATLIGRLNRRAEDCGSQSPQ